MAAGKLELASKLKAAFDLFAAEFLFSAQLARNQRGFCKQLKTFHAVIGGDKVGAHGYGSVVFKQYYVVFGKIFRNRIGDFLCGRCAVLCGIDWIDEVKNYEKDVLSKRI